MTNMIKVCSDLRWARVFIINTRPDENPHRHGFALQVFHSTVSTLLWAQDIHTVDHTRFSRLDFGMLRDQT